MIFGEFPLHAAEGVLLAHSLRLPERTLRKGRRLGVPEIEALRAANRESVYGCRLDVEDVDENQAAAQVAAVLQGDGTHAARPGAGHCNLVADVAGLVRLDPHRIEALNLLDEDLLVATAAPWQRVAPGDLVTRVKIASFAIPGQRLGHCLDAIDASATRIAVVPFRQLRVALILTRLGASDEKRTSELRDGMQRRLAQLGNGIDLEITCGHQPQAVAAAIARARGTGCELIIIGAASATVDRDDMIPAGIRLGGGRIERFGFPLEPGSMLVLARQDDTPILVLPGCARSPKPNGLDGLLARIVAGHPPSDTEMAQWGCGGLLPGQRVKPEGDAKSNEQAKTAQPRIAAIVLAAGRSQRMGDDNKLLRPVSGTPMVSHAVNAALGVPLAGVVVVTGHQHEQIAATLSAHDITLAHNPDYASGLSSSLRAGLTALPAGIDGVVVLLGDMPLVTAAHLARILDAFAPDAGRSIIVPTFEGTRGNPVLWSRRFFPEMMALEGDVGARRLMRQYPDLVFELAMNDAAVLTDIDTPEILAEWR